MNRRRAVGGMAAEQKQGRQSDDGGGGRWLKPEPEYVYGEDDGRRSGSLSYYDQKLTGFTINGGDKEEEEEEKQGNLKKKPLKVQKQGKQHKFKLSAELSAEPVRRPGAVPFIWEQSPGKRRSPPPTTLLQLFRKSDASPAATSAAAAATSAATSAADLLYDSDTCSFVSADDTRSFASGSTCDAGDGAASRGFLLQRFLPAAHAAATPSPADNHRLRPPHSVPYASAASAARRTISDALAAASSDASSSCSDSDQQSLPPPDSPHSGACSGFLALRIFGFRNYSNSGIVPFRNFGGSASRRRHSHALRQIARKTSSTSASFVSIPAPHPNIPALPSPGCIASHAAISTTITTIKDVLRCGAASSADLFCPSSSLAESPSSSSCRSSVSSSSYSSPKEISNNTNQGIKLNQESTKLIMEINNDTNQGIKLNQESTKLLMEITNNTNQGIKLNQESTVTCSSAFSSLTSCSSSSRTNYGSTSIHYTDVSSPSHSNWSSGIAAEDGDDESSIHPKTASILASPPLPKSPTQSWLMHSLQISSKTGAVIRSPSRLAQMQRAPPSSSPLSSRIAIAELQQQSSRWINVNHRLQSFPEELRQQPNTLQIGA